ncbi:MAG: hypothetical protein QOD08_339 [Gaiellaceae bacterium]|nr:hypothetical protein [Gaiellaceae bacterium]
MIWLYLRLAAATAVLLLPGVFVARALGQRTLSAALAWALAVLAAGMGVMFVVHGSLLLALGIAAALGAVALALALRLGFPSNTLLLSAGPAPLLVLAGGTVLGIALWRLSGPVDGDALFHLARVRKLEAFHHVGIHTVDEFRDGGLHPGYAFPLWHGFLAAVAKLASVDPSLVVRHENSVLAPLAAFVAYEAGRMLFDSPWAGAAAAAAQVGLIAFAPGHGGAYGALALPATSSRQLLVVAALALAFQTVRDPSAGTLASVGAAALAVALVHPTYALFLLFPVFGWAVARLVLERRDWARLALVVAAIAVPSAAVLGALYPVAHESASLKSENRCGAAHGVLRYRTQLDVRSCSSYSVKPETVARGGAIAVVALLLVPLAALARRRLWASFVLGGSLVVLALVLLPFLFPRLADAVSLSQARRAAGFVPFALALTGGLAVAARLLRIAALPVALAGGIAAQLLWPGDFGYRVEHGGPAAAAWIALIGGAVALSIVAFVRRDGFEDEGGPMLALTAALFVLPVAIHGVAHWTAPTPPSGQMLSAGLLHALRADVPRGAVVLSDPETSYRIAAEAPVYILVAPPAHVADTRQNRPRARVREVALYFDGRDRSLPARHGARWVVVDARRSKFRPQGRRVYSDARYSLYRL